MRLCHCGEPLHYRNSETRKMVEKLIEELGEFVSVVIGAKMYRVPRHYIALHGLRGREVEKLGFEEVVR